LKRTPIEYFPSEEDIKLFERIFNKLNSVVHCEYSGSFNFNFNDFTLFRNYSKISVGPVIDINIGYENSFMAFIQAISPSSIIRQHIDLVEYYSWGACFLKHNFGHVIIRPETLSDKIQEFIHSVEIDFEEDKEFSRKFYLLADPNFDSKTVITDKFRKAILEIKSKYFVIEIVNNRLIIGSQKPIDEQTVLDFAIFQNKVCN
jgi:hypothetical protein